MTHHLEKSQYQQRICPLEFLDGRKGEMVETTICNGNMNPGISQTACSLNCSNNPARSYTSKAKGGDVLERKPVVALSSAASRPMVTDRALRWLMDPP
eukprot:CAMPEP_0197716266 /NCGR_PEP_ID=MMETSP1434-20131217/1212_1 /TAXON_ID=265543 /ORGANISM="Minutocellus polymorphus, Strain CCMP3303" /LENGTH=97 /DNA_ID=CAMNT_0043300599 /DNA_START=145 /DNA_END=435 /DNA_ORIENTATION=+